MKISHKISIVFGLTLWLVISHISPCHAQAPSIDGKGEQVISIEVGYEISITGKLRMRMRDFIKKVVEVNERILTQNIDFRISQEAVQIEKSVFEPRFVTSYQRGREKVKYSQEEKSSIILFESGDRDLESMHYDAAVETKVPTGATMRLGYTLRSSRDNVLNEVDEFTSNIGIEVSQPLLKDGGMGAIAKIYAAEADADIAFQAYRQKILQVVLNAAATCWDYYEAKEKLRIRKDSVKIAEQILRDNKQRVKLGKMAKIEVLEAEAGLAKRKSLETMGKQNLITAINNLHAFISSPAVEMEIDIDFEDALKSKAFKPDFKYSMQRAFEYRPEYLAAKKRIDKEDILLAHAKNQRWPKLDLTGSYRFNGLDDSAKDSWDDMFDGDYRTWTVGAVLTVPLLGGMQSRGELQAARERKKQAQLELRAFKVEVANAIYAAIQNVYNTFEQLQYYRNVRELSQKLLDVKLRELEMEEIVSGINIRDVLEKEEDLIEAKEAELESFIENKKAILTLETSEGYLLRRFDVEVMEVKGEQK